MDANEVIELARKHLYIDRTDSMGTVKISGKEALAAAITERLKERRIQKPIQLSVPYGLSTQNPALVSARWLHRDRFFHHMEAYPMNDPEYGGTLLDWAWDWFVENPVPTEVK